jgi:hypothetical protein
MRDNWIGMFPPVCKQKATYSDIYNTTIDHNMSDYDKEQLYYHMVVPVKNGLKAGTIL